MKPVGGRDPPSLVLVDSGNQRSLTFGRVAADEHGDKENWKMSSELLGNETARAVTMTLRLKVRANVYDAYKEAAKLARELNRRWAPEEAAARWLGQQTLEALKELRAEKSRRDADAKGGGDRARSQAA